MKSITCCSEASCVKLACVAELLSLPPILVNLMLLSWQMPSKSGNCSFIPSVADSKEDYESLRISSDEGFS
ncbi:hypothetical protein F383_17002 [Gossypium arboreum]|uniref:Uncharacterized protein n=2 Tax=Gossypium arboreum TaxID=29729 RepID=A0A0B0NFW6_GOSAR|nr:hypothetical protein PVK06_041360 [Gossypium arboreum]KHG10704.1 hypothetical protein F383_16342 [Gossypium arboreum]KHG13072.1 hypothetical protein F383_17002 [Gossypium arboreum]